MAAAKGEKYGWYNRQITRNTDSDYNVYYRPVLDKPMMFQCLRCNDHYLHDECGNCGSHSFECGTGLGVYCSRCERGFTSWTCPECDTSNPASKTLYLLTTKGCFIATAAYGSSLAPQVTLLSQFRDVKLKPNPLGRGIIRIYERYSPPLADWIAERPTMRLWVQRILLAPIVWIVHRFLR